MLRLLSVASVLVVVVAALTYAQLPPAEGLDGAPFLKVNINPTNIPPQVNINPYNTTPRVAVTEMPEVRFPPSACADRRNFRTGIAQAITGPLMVTYLNTSEQNVVSIGGNQGAQRVNLSQSAQLTTAIYLEAGQTLEFESAILYSGCVPD